MPTLRQTRVRYLIVFMLFVASSFSYGDRVVLSIVGVALSKQMHLDALHPGYLLSAFSRAYVVAQLPAGSLLDRFGSKRLYGYSIVAWACCGILAGFTHFLPAVIAFGGLFFLRMLSGIEVDMAEVEKAYEAYQRLPAGARNDAAAMQYLLPGWAFDPKKPCLVVARQITKLLRYS